MLNIHTTQYPGDTCNIKLNISNIKTYIKNHRSAFVIGAIRLSLRFVTRITHDINQLLLLLIIACVF